MACFARHPSSLSKFWPDRIFLASYIPDIYVKITRFVRFWGCKRETTFESLDIMSISNPEILISEFKISRESQISATRRPYPFTMPPFSLQQKNRLSTPPRWLHLSIQGIYSPKLTYWELSVRINPMICWLSHFGQTHLLSIFAQWKCSGSLMFTQVWWFQLKQPCSTGHLGPPQISKQNQMHHFDLSTLIGWQEFQQS